MMSYSSQKEHAQSSVIWALGVCLMALLMVGGSVRAADLSHGLMYAMPAPHGVGPKINGSLKGWNMAGADEVFIATPTAKKLHALAALEYTQKALYYGVRVSLPHRKLINPHNSLEAFWWGDQIELRVVSDPKVAYPLNANAPNVKRSKRVANMAFWKDSQNGKCYLDILYGPARAGLGHVVNPPGTAIAIVEHGRHSYTMTARIPWSVLNAPGGVNPFKPGQKMIATLAIHWRSAPNAAPGVYRRNPGDFSFLDLGAWGQVEFAKKGQLVPPRTTLAQYLASLRHKSLGVPITVNVPRKEKVSINIFSPHGRVIRELMCGQLQPAGPLTVHWDGRDGWGAPVPLGTYKWGAYFSPGITVKYVGSAGISGTPPYPTANGIGGWGGDHGPAIDVAADQTGMYFMWDCAEAGRALIKVNYQGQTLWRMTPFVGGGFGPQYALATNGRDVFGVFSGSDPALFRVRAATGSFLHWPDGKSLAAISHSKMVAVPPSSSPLGIQPECCGVAANATEVFCPVYSKNQIRVFNPHTGGLLRTLKCPGPRGVCLDGEGNLFAVSYVPGKPGRIVEFHRAVGAARVVVANHLAEPWHVAVDAQGNIHVTDEGASQQVKVFSSTGQLIQTLGQRGGRPWAGKYVASNYLLPAGIAADAHGGIITAQAALPKVISLNSAATGKVLHQWFGGLGYSSEITPGARHPRTVYVQYEPAGFSRCHILGGVKPGIPTAYWLLPQAGYHSVGTLGDFTAQTRVVLAENGQRYFVCDANPHGIALIRGDQMLPVAHFLVRDQYQRHRGARRNELEIWSDANGDHHIQPGEVQRVFSLAGKPLPSLAESTGSMYMAKNGDIYLVTNENSIVEIPAAGFRANGSIKWDLSKARYAVPVVLARAGRYLGTSARYGILGLRVDSHGNIYTCVDATVPYYTQALTKAMSGGIGHDNCCNAVKFMKFSPNGKLLWMAGRKAAGVYSPGELHHFWVIAGLVGNKYVAGASEWGQFYFYTHDGFYVGSLMNQPALAPLPGPYTFGSETFSGVVKYFPRLNQVWAYMGGMAYRVGGFNHGVVQGQSRQWGTVRLAKIYPAVRDGVAIHRNMTPLVLTRTDGIWTRPELWRGVARRELQRNGKPLASVRVSYGRRYVYARFHVLQGGIPINAAGAAKLLFDGGGSVGLDLGPAGHATAQPVRGDVRILAALVHGKPEMVGWKPISRRFKHPTSYYTPAGGHVHFAFVGVVPGGKAVITGAPRGQQGYVAVLAVPRSFLDLPLKPGGKIAADVEVNGGGYANRGLQLWFRNYLFSPQNGITTMVNDMPTEARLNPQWWGTAVLK